MTYDKLEDLAVAIKKGELKEVDKLIPEIKDRYDIRSQARGRDMIFFTGFDKPLKKCLLASAEKGNLDIAK